MTHDRPLNLLISNDDGIFATGVRTLVDTLARAGHNVTVVCPDGERSATGHGLTLHQPIRTQKIEAVFHPAVKAWSCSGTPADCVKLALNALLDQRPDFVLAGINHGSNLGTDILYSGTVSAAMEGIIEGLPSIAVSLASFASKEFPTAARFVADLLERLRKNPLPEATLLNINVPPVKPEAIAGVAICRQGVRRYIEQFEKRIDPRGKSYYWLAGKLLRKSNNPNTSTSPPTFPRTFRPSKRTILQLPLCNIILLMSAAFTNCPKMGC